MRVRAYKRTLTSNETRPRAISEITPILARNQLSTSAQREKERDREGGKDRRPRLHTYAATMTTRATR